MATASISLGQSFLPLLTSLRRADHPVIVFDGNRGSGKTRGILTVIMALALKYPKTPWALWRSKRRRLSKTVLTTLEKQVFPAFGMTVPGKAVATNRTQYILPNGSELIPIGLDDIYRSTSFECAGGYLNEGIELAHKEQAMALLGACRHAGVPMNQFYIDTNPGPPGHWLNKACEQVPEIIRALPKSRADYDRIQMWNRTPAPDPLHIWKRVICGHEDNPGYFDVENWRYIPLGQRYVTNALEGLTGAMRSRWKDRRWEQQEGVVFPEFTHEHIIPPYPNGIPKSWPCILAKDPAQNHHDATIVIAVSPAYVELKDDDGQPYRMHKLIICGESVTGNSSPFGRGTSVQEDAVTIDKLFAPNFRIVRKLGDPHYMFSKTKHGGGETIEQQFRKHGHIFERAPAASNQAEIAAQCDMVRTRLTTRDRMGEPMIQVFSTCTETINGFQTWGYKRNAQGGMTGGEDRFEDLGDDEMDCVRMVIATNPQFASPRVEVYTPAD